MCCCSMYSREWTARPVVLHAVSGQSCSAVYSAGAIQFCYIIGPQSCQQGKRFVRCLRQLILCVRGLHNCVWDSWYFVYEVYTIVFETVDTLCTRFTQLCLRQLILCVRGLHNCEYSYCNFMGYVTEWFDFWRVRIVAKSAHWLRHDRLSPCYVSAPLPVDGFPCS